MPHVKEPGDSQARGYFFVSQTHKNARIARLPRYMNELTSFLMETAECDRNVGVFTSMQSNTTVVLISIKKIMLR